MKNLIRQHNDFVAAPYAVEFTAHEIKLIEYMISESKHVDKDYIDQKRHKEFVISANRLAKILNTSLSRVVADADKLANSITNKKITEKTLDTNGVVKEFSYIPLISLAKYEKGTFTFAFNFYILRYFVDINKNFTEFQLSYLLSMTSTYAIKLYKLLYQYKNIGKRLFYIDELKEQFGLCGKYPLYGGFKQKVIAPAVKQVNEKTDLDVYYHEIKLGRSVDRIEFCFEMKKPSPIFSIKRPEIQLIESDNEVSLHSLARATEDIQSELSTATLELLGKYYKEYGMEYVVASISYAKQHAKTNLDKYLTDTLSGHWAELEMKKVTNRVTARTTKLLHHQQELDKKKREREAENIAKSAIEHQWNKLLDSEKSHYLNLANYLLAKYTSKLTAFHSLSERLHLSVYAVSNQQFYDRMLESYFKTVLQVSLDIHCTIPLKLDKLK